METRQIGSLKVSVVGLGCNNFGGRIDSAASREVIHAAVDAGITLFDTAGGVDAAASKKHLYELAQRLEVPGRSRMSKDQLVEALQKANDRETARARR